MLELHPPMLKIGQNWGKITNYPPQSATKIGTTKLEANILEQNGASELEKKFPLNCSRTTKEILFE